MSTTNEGRLVGAAGAGEVQEIYRQLKAALQREDLAPGVRMNLEQALSAVSLAMNNLGLEYEPLYDLGV